ncbi:carbohydrate ABC transporter permease [Desertihabitans brevis]|uniref:carbohydrate ABC transporter permease n=1 Tax=Desertihabitans brevis TaxID=2268447 RepID=UPI0011BF5A61|nr:sugar ABC transporter permease [Desertihabitans brevis]
MSATTPALQRRVQTRVGGWYERSTTRWCYLFLLPALVLTAMFSFYPMVMSWVYSTMDWSGFSDDMSFVGLANYAELVRDRFFWDSFGRSAVFVLVGTPVRVGLALLLAIVLNRQVLRLSVAFRTMFFLPVMASASIIGVVMTFVLSPSNGPVNAVLAGSGVVDAPVGFLSDPDLALWTALVVHGWKNFGTTMIYWLAALQTVPEEYYEAARLDGAGAWALMRHITLPILVPFAVIIIVLTAKENLHAFAIVQAMTQGGPYFRSEVIEIYIFRTAFAPDGGALPRLGYASAAGCFFGTATLLLALAQFWAVRRMGGRGRTGTPAVDAGAPAGAPR